MIAIAVDDEFLMLGALVKAVSASPDISEVTKFSDCEQALDLVKGNRVDIAFLDINMRGMGGLALAERIVAARPDCKIVFCTGYEEYAIPAFKLHASGYLMKPISPEDVQAEIDNIKGSRQKERVLTVKCFGNFEVYVKNEKLVFKRLKTKELFAFLILIDQRTGGNHLCDRDIGTQFRTNRTECPVRHTGHRAENQRIFNFVATEFHGAPPFYFGRIIA